MSKKYLRVVMFSAVMGLLSIHYVNASSVLNAGGKTSIIRVTSADPGQPNIQFDGSLLTSTRDKRASITNIHATTPWEVTVSDEYVRYIMKTELQNPMLQVQTLEKTGHGDDVRTTGTGHVFDGIESNCDESGCVTSGIHVLN